MNRARIEELAKIPTRTYREAVEVLTQCAKECFDEAALACKEQARNIYAGSANDCIDAIRSLAEEVGK